MIITVLIKSVYGNPKVYPVGREAQLFADIAGTKTLGSFALASILNLGYTIEVLDSPYTLKRFGFGVEIVEKDPLFAGDCDFIN